MDAASLCIERVTDLGLFADQRPPAATIVHYLSMPGLLDALPGAARYVIPLIAALSLASLFAAAFRLPSWCRLLALILLGCAMLPLPLLVPRESRLARGIEAIFCAMLLIKLYDVHVGIGLGRTPTFRRFLVFLLHPLALVERRLAETPAPARRDSLRRLARGAVVGAGALLLLSFLWKRIEELDSFVIEHTTKALLSFAAAYGVMNVVAALWYLAGGRGPYFADNFFLSLTPADFWRRYNRPVREYFNENVFSRLRHRRRRSVLVAAVLIAFVISGAVHEYLATIAARRLVGFELLFFIVQGIAVALTFRSNPRSPAARAGWWFLTVVFMLASSTLFFGGVNQFLRWYSDAAPAWLTSPGASSRAARRDLPPDAGRHRTSATAARPRGHDQDRGEPRP